MFFLNKVMSIVWLWLNEWKFAHDFALSITQKNCSEWVSLEEKSISSGGLWIQHLVTQKSNSTSRKFWMNQLAQFDEVLAEIFEVKASWFIQHFLLVEFDFCVTRCCIYKPPELILSSSKETHSEQYFSVLLEAKSCTNFPSYSHESNYWHNFV